MTPSLVSPVTLGLALALACGCKIPTASGPAPKPTLEDALGRWTLDAYLVDEQGCAPKPAHSPLVGLEVRRAEGELQAIEIADCTSFEACAPQVRPEDRLIWRDDQALARGAYTYASPATEGEIESWCKVGRVDSELRLDGPRLHHTRQHYEALIAMEGDLECAPALADELGEDTPCVRSEVFELVPYTPPSARAASE
ncbi:hypothetical protein DL240_17780 [Lujinxingia litoralis]|uniref:Uncharacterized protein n=1 Tax=Lujinxingia litoralis TaxID=2211119 RepID=A0A328C4K2_9DELT|nr:hypothetical protein [Lujinxingia litoralis]RAL20232.1 hypothetical protein DL240_17780 [Lujinxingia litoralis]